jgi:hypothetical protein
MLIYSVTVNVENNIAEEWVQWMKEIHIPDVMGTGCFVEAHFSQLLEPVQDDESTTFNVQYACVNQEKLDFYLQTFAPALRQHAIDVFGDQFVAFRTILKRL